MLLLVPPLQGAFPQELGGSKKLESKGRWSFFDWLLRVTPNFQQAP